MALASLHILKFGGTSVGKPESIRVINKIVNERLAGGRRAILVVSAFSGVTNQLVRISDLAVKRDAAYQDELELLRARHKEMIAALLSKKAKQTEEAIAPLLNELSEIIHGAFLLRECSPRTRDFILSFGERLSASIIAGFLAEEGKDAAMVDARQLVFTDEQFGEAHVDIATSYSNMREYFADGPEMPVVTGFIASTHNGVTTTLGRGGSDYTASLLGAALDAREIEIWTDVSGVMTTNPALVKNAFSLHKLTYDEAMELSHFGAKVLHPPTIQPALEKKIPIRIRNTFDLAFEGTLISSEADATLGPLTGLTAIDQVALITIQGSGMVGVPGVAARLFQALAQKEINVILITQASSEHSICVGLKPEDAVLARKVIESTFRPEIQLHEIDPVKMETGLSAVAVVGQRMRHTPGIAGRLFHALGSVGINVVAMAQGSSELNISLVIRKEDQKQALNVLHRAFFEEGKTTQKGRLFIAGSGQIGRELLRQLNAQNDKRLTLHAICNSRRMVISEKALGYDGAITLLDKQGKKADLSAFVSAMSRDDIFIDVSASEEVASRYGEIVKRGVHIAAANKIAFAGDEWPKLKKQASDNNAHLAYEATAGAGLPALHAIRLLTNGGDKVTRIEGVLSGTLSWLFNQYDGSAPFSKLVKKAKKMGFTEPDPRIDLSGIDAARKILILARLAGAQKRWKNVRLEGFLPPACTAAPDVVTFFTALEASDDYFRALHEDAGKQGKRLRFIARYDEKGIVASLQQVGKDDPFYTLSGSDNMLAIYSRYYSDSPLVIRGTGAGKEVTAQGVLNDILSIMDKLNGR